MNINSDTMISISEANQNFSKVARLVDQYGAAVILKNNAPKYILLTFDEVEKAKEKEAEPVSDDEFWKVSEKLFKRNKKVYEELAK